ncbi:hypothetical protein MRX96_036251 [Rhipicephalus microplus]
MILNVYITIVPHLFPGLQVYECPLLHAHLCGSGMVPVSVEEALLLRSGCAASLYRGLRPLSAALLRPASKAAVLVDVAVVREVSLAYLHVSELQELDVE